MKTQWQKFKKSMFINSFKKLDSRLFLIMLFDFLFFFIVIGAAMSWAYIIADKASKLDAMPLEDVLQMATQDAQQYLSLIKEYFIFFIVSLLMLLIVSYLAYCLFTGIVWTIIMKKKFTLNHFLRFTLFNLVHIWVLLISTLLISAITLFFGYAMKNIANMYILVPLMLVLMVIVILPLTLAILNITNIAYYFFTKGTQRLFSGIWKALELTFSNNIKKLYKAYFWMGVVVLASSLISLIPLPDKIAMFIFIITSLFELAWMRLYLTDVVESL